MPAQTLFSSSELKIRFSSSVLERAFPLVSSKRGELIHCILIHAHVFTSFEQTHKRGAKFATIMMLKRAFPLVSSKRGKLYQNTRSRVYKLTANTTTGIQSKNT